MIITSALFIIVYKLSLLSKSNGKNLTENVFFFFSRVKICIVQTKKKNNNLIYYTVTISILTRDVKFT